LHFFYIFRIGFKEAASLLGKAMLYSSKSPWEPDYDHSESQNPNPDPAHLSYLRRIAVGIGFV
jgi:hypothetical protein